MSGVRCQVSAVDTVKNFSFLSVNISRHANTLTIIIMEYKPPPSLAVVHRHDAAGHTNTLTTIIMECKPSPSLAVVHRHEAAGHIPLGQFRLHHLSSPDPVTTPFHFQLVQDDAGTGDGARDGAGDGVQVFAVVSFTEHVTPRFLPVQVTPPVQGLSTTL